MLADDLVRNRAARHRNRDHAAARAVHGLADRFGHFVRLAGREPDAALAIAHRDERVEREAPAALHDLRDAIDRDDVLDELGAAFVTAAATSTVTPAAAAIATTAPARSATLATARCATPLTAATLAAAALTATTTSAAARATATTTAAAEASASAARRVAAAGLCSSALRRNARGRRVTLCLVSH